MFRRAILGQCHCAAAHACTNLGHSLRRIHKLLADLIAGIKPRPHRLRSTTRHFVKRDDRPASQFRAFLRNRQVGALHVILPSIQNLHDVPIRL